jgi:hypothetical protein
LPKDIKPLKPGDYAEHVVYDDKGNFLYRDTTVASESRSKGWQEFQGEFTVKDMGVSEKYKPISLPKYYEEDDNIDKPDAPVTVDLSEAERKLKSMGYL